MRTNPPKTPKNPTRIIAQHTYYSFQNGSPSQRQTSEFLQHSLGFALFSLHSDPSYFPSLGGQFCLSTFHSGRASGMQVESTGENEGKGKVLCVPFHLWGLRTCKSADRLVQGMYALKELQNIDVFKGQCLDLATYLDLYALLNLHHPFKLKCGNKYTFCQLRYPSNSYMVAFWHSCLPTSPTVPDQCNEENRIMFFSMDLKDQ